jgi:hypothetical protein
MKGGMRDGSPQPMIMSSVARPIAILVVRGSRAGRERGRDSREQAAEEVTYHI